MEKKGKENSVLTAGAEFGSGLRETSKYTETQEALLALGLVESVLNQTPPVGLNLKILMDQMPEAVLNMKNHLPNNPSVSLLGLAILDGVKDVQKVIKKLDKGDSQISVIDIDESIINEVSSLQLDGVETFHEDATSTSLSDETQDLVIRDHLGNCCPPEMYAKIEAEVARVTNPSGLSLVNITTSEVLKNSQDRRLISLDKLKTILSKNVIEALRSRIFSLSQLSEEFPEIDTDALRGCLLEIAPGSFVVFGEDTQGHGEWFSAFSWQKQLWKENGFKIINKNTREGQDSHEPPLECVRHIVLLQKDKEEK